MSRSERLSDLSPTRRALLAAGVATLAVSLVLSIAPAFGKSSSGTVKLHDVTTNQDVSGNNPHVCSFVVVFDFASPTQTGAWQILAWDVQGHPQVLSGTYDTSVNGTDQTDPITLDAGHYRLEYQADGASNSKNKEFWVDDTCGAAGSSATASATPSEEPSDSPSADPSTAPSGDPSEAASATPSATPSDEPTESPSQAASTVPSSSASTEPSQDPSQEPSQDPIDQPQGETGSSDPSSSPEEQVLATSGSPAASAAPRDGAAAGSGSNQLPDTSTSVPVGLTSLLTAMGLLMIVAAHPFIRRSAHADRA